MRNKLNQKFLHISIHYVIDHNCKPEIKCINHLTTILCNGASFSRVFWSGDRQLYVGDLDTTYYESITTYDRGEPTALSYDPQSDSLYVAFPDSESGGTVVTRVVVSDRSKTDVFRHSQPITSLSTKPTEFVFTDNEVSLST